MIQQPKIQHNPAMTAHAYLLPFGEYARTIGVIEEFQQVAVAQKTCVHTPQSKLLEAFVGTLAGMRGIKDLSLAEHPLDQDELVADAWDQKSWADYSGVARTLQQVSQAEVEKLITGLQRINQGFIRQEVELALAEVGYLVVDGDLSCIPVCKQSTRFPQVAYGHMSDMVRLGYQVGLVSLHSPRYGRLWLSIEHHPGNVTSVTQALNLVRAAEAALGGRPKRRPDLLAQRIVQHEQVGQVVWDRLATHRQAWQSAQAEQQQRKQQVQEGQAQVTQLEQVYAAKDRPERACSQLAKAHQQLERLHKRLTQAAEKDHKLAKSLQRLQQQWAQHEQTGQELTQRLAHLIQENEHNAQPLRILLRMDAGFGSYANLIELIELGYEIYTKARSAQVVRSLLAEVPADFAWVRVGPDALLATWQGFRLPNFAYPVQVAVARFKDPPHLKHNVLLYFGPESRCEQPQAWYVFYNGRQTIEAGIKEQKHIFYLHRIKVRSLPAIVLQEYLVLFAANFIRWAMRWMQTLPPPPAPWQPHTPSLSIKRAVQVGTHTSAYVHASPAGRLIAFTHLSCFFHQALWLPAQPTPIPKKMMIFSHFPWFEQWLHKT
ncbi:MAG: hypothetical protein EHM21_11130 [Chloroflexi bacterium]|nr:MAG: hypothetical protein EHM21_11130 [Chloroflexota bacterium]